MTIWQAVVFSNDVPHTVNAQIYNRAVLIVSKSNIDITTFHNNEINRDVYRKERAKRFLKITQSLY